MATELYIKFCHYSIWPERFIIRHSKKGFGHILVLEGSLEYGTHSWLKFGDKALEYLCLCPRDAFGVRSAGVQGQVELVANGFKVILLCTESPILV
jgi:hypothetical protein